MDEFLQVLAAIVAGVIAGRYIAARVMPDTGLDYTDALIVHRLTGGFPAGPSGLTRPAAVPSRDRR